MQPPQEHPHSLRLEERQYEQQIRTTYADFPHYFATHSSDSLHLETASREHQGGQYTALVAKTNYSKYDCILELRGSVIRYDTLKRVVQEGKVEVNRLPLLLYLNLEKGYLLSPKNISRYLFQHPLLQTKQALAGNCYIQNHYGTKLLCVASRDIAAGEELLLQRRSFANVLYKFSLSEL